MSNGLKTVSFLLPSLPSFLKFLRLIRKEFVFKIMAPSMTYWSWSNHELEVWREVSVDS